MAVSDISPLLVCESDSVEWKTSLSDSKRIIETIAAMATGGGGTIVVGIRDNGTVVGADVAKGNAERLVQQCLAATDPKVYFQLEKTRIDGKDLLLIRVAPGEGPHLAFGRAFHRIGPATVAMSRDEYERRLLDRLRESSGFERRAELSLGLENIDPTAVSRFITQVHATGRQQNIGLTISNVLVGLHIGDQNRLSTAAVLLFATNPQGPFPQATVRCRAKRGASEDETVAEGNLFVQIEQAASFVARNLHTRSSRDGIRRTEIPEIPFSAIREAITNAVVHRDYRSTAPIQLRLSDQSLVIWNPGHLPSPITPALLYGPHPSVPTNPLIARALYLAGYIEEWGSGTLRIIDAMREADLPPPSFQEETGGIRVELLLPGNHTQLPLRQAKALKTLPSDRPFRNAEYADLASVSLRTANADLVDLELRGMVSREGQGRSTRWIKKSER